MTSLNVSVTTHQILFIELSVFSIAACLHLLSDQHPSTSSESVFPSTSSESVFLPDGIECRKLLQSGFYMENKTLVDKSCSANQNSLDKCCKCINTVDIFDIVGYDMSDIVGYDMSDVAACVYC